jgi:hypothetical protein
MTAMSVLQSRKPLTKGGLGGEEAGAATGAAEEDTVLETHNCPIQQLH